MESIECLDMQLYGNTEYQKFVSTSENIIHNTNFIVRWGSIIRLQSAS